MDLVLVGDPSIPHRVITNCIQECFHGFLPGAYFLEKQEDVPQFLLAKVLVGGDEPNCKKNCGTWLYW
jgi:hypothetical protein